MTQISVALLLSIPSSTVTIIIKTRVSTDAPIEYDFSLFFKSRSSPYLFSLRTISNINSFTYPLLAGGYGKEVFIMSKCIVIAVANQKSGVGKITTTENVAIGKQIC